MEGKVVSLSGLVMSLKNDEGMICEVEWFPDIGAVAVAGYWYREDLIHAGLFCLLQTLVCLHRHPDGPNMHEWNDMVEAAADGMVLYGEGSMSDTDMHKLVTEWKSKRDQPSKD